MLALIIIACPQKSWAACPASDKTCIMEELLQTSTAINEVPWRDKVLRELAKSYTHEGLENQALSLIDKIQSPDTKALTIRGIGFAAANNKWSDKKRYDSLFKNLTIAAEKIEHKPSHAIAYTYIAMAQSFANDDAGAMATAKSMTDEALRNKAYGESAEIQAERDDLSGALTSIEAINSVSYKNKAYGTVADIFIKKGDLNAAYTCAQKIDNPYAKAQVLQHVVNFGNKEEMLEE